MLHKCHDASTQRRIADLLQDYKDKQSVNKGSMVFIQYGKPPELSRNLKEALVMLLTASGSTEIHRLMPPKPKKRVRKNDKDGEEGECGGAQKEAGPGARSDDSLPSYSLPPGTSSLHPKRRRDSSASLQQPPSVASQQFSGGTQTPASQAPPLSNGPAGHFPQGYASCPQQPGYPIPPQYGAIQPRMPPPLGLQFTQGGKLPPYLPHHQPVARNQYATPPGWQQSLPSSSHSDDFQMPAPQAPLTSNQGHEQYDPYHGQHPDHLFPLQPNMAQPSTSPPQGMQFEHPGMPEIGFYNNTITPGPWSTSSGPSQRPPSDRILTQEQAEQPLSRFELFPALTGQAGQLNSTAEMAQPASFLSTKYTGSEGGWNPQDSRTVDPQSYPQRQTPVSSYLNQYRTPVLQPEWHQQQNSWTTPPVNSPTAVMSGLPVGPQYQREIGYVDPLQPQTVPPPSVSIPPDPTMLDFVSMTTGE
jgi:hypothetical protein